MREDGPSSGGTAGPVSSGRLAILVAAALTLIGVVTVASRAEPPVGGSEDGGQTAATLLANGVLLVLAVVAAGLLVMVAYSFSIGRVARPPGRPGPGLFAQFALIAIVMAAVMYWRTQAPTERPDQGADELEVAPFAKGPEREEAAERPSPPPVVDWRLVAVAFGGAVVVFGVAGWLWLRQGTPLGGAPALARRLTLVFDETLADLRAERDPRRAVIAAYARMEQLLGREGLPRHPAEAPHEYVGRVLGELQASGASVGRLTALYERARFSDHEVPASMKDEAIAAVEAVRDDLRASESVALTPELAT